MHITSHALKMVELVFSDKLRQAFRKGADDSRLDANLRKELCALVADAQDTVPYPTVLSFWKAASAAGNFDCGQ